MKLYVPNPQYWKDFFERIEQSGHGKRRRVITVNKPIAVNAVLPTEQTTAQAESELKREGIKPKDVEKAAQSTTRQRKNNKSSGAVIGKKRKATTKTTVSKKQKGNKDIFEN